MWHRGARQGLLAVSVMLAGFLVYVLATRVESVPTPGLMPALLGRADASIDHFTFRETRAGAVQWEVKAARARVFEAEQRADLEEVEVTLFGEKGRQLSLRADKGVLDTAKKDFVLEQRNGPIVVNLGSGYTIYTNHLAWTDARREIRTTDPVTIFGQGLEVRGVGLIGNLDSEEFKVLANVRMDVLP